MSGQVMVRSVRQTETYNNRKSTGWKIEINLSVTSLFQYRHVWVSVSAAGAKINLQVPTQHKLQVWGEH